MSRRPTERLRKICLALPEAAEKEAWGDPTFRVRDKIFAMEKRGDGRVSVWLKAPEGSQSILRLDPKAWEERRRRLNALGGPPTRGD